MRITAKHIVRALILLVFYTIHIKAQQYRYLSLPNIEMLSSDKISCVIQDNEGFLWYGTEGGGICRDDGRQIDIFRSDAAHPNLLGSNNIVCLINVKHNVFIGTFHGAYILDKDNYNIKQLKDVDEKRVDNMIKTTDKHIWLTANKKYLNILQRENFLIVLSPMTSIYPVCIKINMAAYRPHNGTEDCWS